MHARNLIELAALVAIHGQPLVLGGERLPEWCLKQYWTASRCRHERWSRILKTGTATAGNRRAATNEQWRTLRATLEEIITGELLTRVWTAVACAYDLRRPVADAGPIARSVLSGQLEAHNRALNLLVYGQGFELQDVMLLDRLRRRTEHWTDLLLANLRFDFDIRDLAFEPERTLEFSASLREEREHSAVQTTQLTVAAIRAAFGECLIEPTPNSHLNRRIASSIFACFRPVPLAAVGRPQSLWLERLHSTTSDSLGWIRELLMLDGTPV